MTNTQHTKQRMVAIALSSRGFGFCIFEGNELLDWGNREVKAGNKNDKCLAKIERLIAQYQPAMLTMQNIAGSRRAQRIKKLSRKIIALARAHRLKVKLFSEKQINAAFGGNAETKHERAEIIAARFPDTLGLSLPPKRKAWMSEDARMDIFEAAAVAMANTPLLASG